MGGNTIPARFMQPRKSGVLFRFLVFAAAMLAVCLLACGTFAGKAYAGEPTADAQLTTQATKYAVWVGGKRVTSANKNDVLGDGHVSYNPKTNTLTLSNATIKKSRVHQIFFKGVAKNTNDGIVAQTGGTFKIKLVGTSTIAGPYKRNMIYSTGITCSQPDGWNLADLVILGDGKLTVTAPKAQCYSIGVTAYSLTVKGSAKLIARGVGSTEKGKTGKYGGYGFSVGDKVLITGNAQVTASGSKAAYYDGDAIPTYKSYTPLVKYGASSKSTTTAISPDSSVYTDNKYVSITKATSKKPGKVNLTSVGSGYRSLTLYWNELKAATSYQIQVAEDSSFPDGATYNHYVAGYEGKSTAQCTIEGVMNGTTYYTRIRASNAKGDGAWSVVRSVVPGGGVG